MPFALWLHEQGFNLAYAEEVDDLLVEYKHQKDVSKTDFQNLVSAVEMLWPRFKGQLSWARAVLTGWDVARIPRHTTPLPRSLTFLVSAHLCVRKHGRLGVGLMVQQRLGLRPSEMLNLIREDISLPEDGDSGRNTAIFGLEFEPPPKLSDHR
jgi:integrase